MNKLNTKLASFFLISGSLFFIFFIYMVLAKEVFKGPPTKLVSINSITIVKNQMTVDSQIIKYNLQLKNHISLEESEKDEMYKTDYCIVQLINLKDNIVYAKSDEFNFELSILNTPFKIDFINENNAKLPNSFMDDDFKLVIVNNEKNIAEFNIGKLKNCIDLKNENFSLNSNSVIKLSSSNHKLDILAEFQIH